MTPTATRTGIVHLTERAAADLRRRDGRLPRAAAAVRRCDVRVVPRGPGLPVAAGGEEHRSWPSPGWPRRPSARRLLPAREEGPRAQARRLSRRRLRRRQDPPARRDLPRDAGAPEVLRLVHRVHGARRRARLPEHRRAVPRLRSALHRRVRTRRPGRHDGDDAAAGRARLLRARGWPRHPTPRRTRSARAGSPRRTSSARSTRWPRASRRSASTAPTTATAPRRARGRARARRSTRRRSRMPPRAASSRTTRSPIWSRTWRACTRRATSA